MTTAEALRSTLPILERVLAWREREPPGDDREVILEPWKLVAIDEGFALTRCWEDPRLGDRPVAIARSWQQGARWLAVLSSQVRAPTYAVMSEGPLRDDGIVDIVRRFGGRTEVVARAPHRQAADVVRTLRVVEAMQRHPEAFALMIESLDYEEMRELVRLVAQRLEALTSAERR